MNNYLTLILKYYDSHPVKKYPHYARVHNVDTFVELIVVKVFSLASLLF